MASLIEPGTTRFRNDLCLSTVPLQFHPALPSRSLNSKARIGVWRSENVARVGYVRRKEPPMSKAATPVEFANSTQQDPRWHSVVDRDSKADGKFFLFGQNNRSVLPPFLWSSPCSPRKRAVSPDVRRRGKSWISSMQTLQARSDGVRCRELTQDFESVSFDREVRTSADAETSCETG